MLMKKLRTFFDLSRAQKHLFLKAIILLLVSHFCIKVIPFRYNLKFFHLKRLEGLPNYPTTNQCSIYRISWAVSTASRNLSFLHIRCLAQAFAATVLLHNEGEFGVLILGTRTISGTPGLQAHAWVNCGNITVVGAPTCEDYSPIAYYYQDFIKLSHYYDS
jgi:hypothetical protein